MVWFGFIVGLGSPGYEPRQHRPSGNSARVRSQPRAGIFRSSALSAPRAVISEDKIPPPGRALNGSTRARRPAVSEACRVVDQAPPGRSTYSNPRRRHNISRGLSYEGSGMFRSCRDSNSILIKRALSSRFVVIKNPCVV